MTTPVFARFAAWTLVCASLTLPAAGCSTGSGNEPSGAGARSGSGATGSGGIDVGSGGTTNVTPCESCPDPNAPAPPGCGDGTLTEDEACDDGNLSSGDGCAANCLSVDPGYSCNPPGKPCHVVALCGDGVLSSNEMCDDGNFGDGDGCSARCKLELGYKCVGQPSACSATTCGDALKEGAEGCDDGNAIPLDGCSATCQAEPDCSAGSCTSDCGDGLIINEECDDANTLDGDGCSSLCALEPGFECTQQQSCELVGGECALRVPAVFRDFQATQVDFYCGGATPPPSIAATLSAGKPVLVSGNPGCISSPESFAKWYTDHAEAVTIPSSLLLFDNGSGGFVNRWGANGERWVDLNGVEMDGTPAFFPIDDAPNAFTDARIEATVPPVYTGDDNWHPESDFVAAATHNFRFTTEVQYWFRYDTGFAAELEFLGDDDVWVFVNGNLALDLGGLHEPLGGNVVVSDATAADYGLESGNVYSIKVFHAERNPTGSSFKLTLSGFEASPSDCAPICGDGIVSLGEQCDDGVNDGGYGECDPGCLLGARCGDGLLQEGEDCDDGNRFDGDGCGSACRDVVVK